jgi:hypothetical protein
MLAALVVSASIALPTHASVDPVQADPHTGEHFNRYAYAGNNPYRYVDPDGRLPIAIPIVMGVGWLLTSGHANAPAPGDATHAMSPGEAFERFSGVVPQSRALAVGRTITFEVAPIHGNPQVTRSKGVETTHGPTSQRAAVRDSNRDGANSVHLNQTVTTITGGAIRSPVRPDVATVRSDGKIDVTEVLSPGQDAAKTIQKYKDALGDRAGTITCIQQDAC